MSAGKGKLKPFINIPVGEFIKDELEFRGWNQEDLANIMDTSLKTVNQIIKGKQGITVQTAIKLGTIFGQSPEYWLNLYNTYCIIESEKVPEEKSKTSELRRLYEKYPISELKKKYWIPK
ncbi:MAG: HigA family addiction module antidote protein, partial [Candidatus Delongbacteria bacterium]|nr:HigA family addiction module antidote protein [Candidatus Delongbacteria bacterium]